MELATLLGVETVGVVRTTGEGREKLFSLIDVAMLVSGKDARHSALDVAEVKEKFSEVYQKVVHFQFTGQGQRETPVADLRTTLLVVLRLRSRVAQKLSAKIVDVFVRYIGGDPELARETLENREFQEHLAREKPDHPARVFAEALSSPTQQQRAKPAVEFNAPPGTRGTGVVRPDLYIGIAPNLQVVKIGNTNNLKLRQTQHRGKPKDDTTFSDKDYYHVLCSRGYGHLDQLLLEAHSDRRINNSDRLRGTEIDVDVIIAMIPQLQEKWEEANPMQDDEHTRGLKRRREESDTALHVTAQKAIADALVAGKIDTARACLDILIEAKRAEADARRAEDLKEEQHKQNLEISRLEFTLKKTKLEKELYGQQQSLAPLVTEEMAKLFAQTYMTLAESLDKASRIGEVHRALAKAHGFQKTPQGQLEAFTAAGFVAKKYYFQEGKPYKLI